MSLLKMRTVFLLVLFTGLISLQLRAGEDEDKPFGLFEDKDRLNVSLSFDIAAFMREKPEDEYLDASIMIYTEGADTISADIQVSARGNFRRRNCDFPPLMLNFKDAETGYPDIDALKKVKLVSHCMPDEDYETYVLREYLAYKIYNIVTDYSFRVRLLNISYCDINHDTLYASKTGFLLEPVSMLEDRLGMDEIEDIEISNEAVEEDVLLKLSVFQHLIANSDWLVSIMHNLKVFGDEESLGNLIAVPYDFDFTGWVNAAYAVAREDMGVEDIRDRVYLGPCRSEEEYRDVLDYYMEKKDVFIDTIKEFKYLEGHNRRDLIRYIRSFYRLYRKDKIIDNYMKTCNNK
ncbi:MAG: hypothetical protein U5K32_07575 [Bacteroidales bacterium]|nr:hypothetical protein [Bacteroidales bacterium]